MNNTIIKKIKELVENDANLKEKLENSESIDDIVSLLRENGIEVSDEFIASAIEQVEGQTSELNEADLEEVAGGYCKKGRNWKCFWSYMSGVLDGIYDALK